MPPNPHVWVCRADVVRLLDWYPFQSTRCHIDRLFYTRLLKSDKLDGVYLTAGDCIIVARWFGCLVPALVTDHDRQINRTIANFLASQMPKVR